MNDELNSIELVKLALIFTRNNIDEFFKTSLMKETNYTYEELENLTNNYVSSSKLSLER